VTAPAVGLAEPTAGAVTVLGGLAAGSPAALDGIAFVAQDTPLYKNLSAADMLHLTRNLNRRFDQPYAKARLGELGIPLSRRAGKLSGGQQAQLALTLALARRPRLLVLDEPVAMLDPLARHDFMALVLTAAADDGVSVLLSSHVLAELERVADYLILLSRGRVQVAGEVDDLIASAFAVYLWLTGLQMHHAEAAYCHPAGALGCAINFTGRYGETTITAPSFRTFCAWPAGSSPRRSGGGRRDAGRRRLSRCWPQDRAHQFFSRARWNADDLGLAAGVARPATGTWATPVVRA
jgi:ABC-type branched-subunit amino acid transport system ATPase component